MATVRKKNKEDFESLLKRFTDKVTKEGIKKQVKDKECFSPKRRSKPLKKAK